MERRISTLILLCLASSGVGALNVEIPKPLYEYARGDNITLPCKFTPKPDSGTPTTAIISWSAEANEAGAKENQFLTYYFPDKTTDIKTLYEGRVSLDVDIATGKANLRLNSITLADNKIFQCRVMIPRDDEGKLAATTRLVVLVAPSTPICKTEGKAEYGQNINLTCKSEEGSPTPTYKWESRDVRNAPRAPDPRTTDKGGILSLYNISIDTSGYYVCTSTNKIRSASCNITLSVLPPSMNIGSTAGIIAGAVAALIALIVIIYCCCCRKKKEKEEYAMGVREGEYLDKEPERNGERPATDRQDSSRSYDDSIPKGPGDRRDQYEDRSEPDYDRRSDYDDRRSDYDDRRERYSDRTERNERYDDNRHYEDERRYDRDDQRYDRDDRDDRRYDHDDRRYDRHDRRYDDDELYDRDRPPVPSNPKPTRREYDD